MEKPKHKVWEATCLECGEVISNPICPGCLADEMEDLLGREHPEAQLVVREARKAFEAAGNELTTCILCGRQINICPYCFMEDMRGMLADADPKTGEKLTEDYGYVDLE